MAQYDLIVIGGGPAGYLGAERAAHAGLKTLLFEKRSLGGVCLNEGCIPSKALLNSAKMYEHALHSAPYGVKCENVTIDQKAVVARRGRVVKMLVNGVKGKMRGAGVKVVMESATIMGKGADGFIVSAAGKEYTADKLLIASGSSAAPTSSTSTPSRRSFPPLSRGCAATASSRWKTAPPVRSMRSMT